ncbi:MAG TPA: ABC transporter permease [Acidobacteriota bacterium]|jgi:putative ABC transport system permease protein
MKDSFTAAASYPESRGSGIAPSGSQHLRLAAHEHTGMPVSDGFKIALQSLRANKLRTFLTLLGVIIGITSIIAVISIIRGLDIYWQEKVADLGANVFIVDQFGIITSHEAFLDAIKRNRELKMEDFDAVRSQLWDAQEVGARIGMRETLGYGNQKMMDVIVAGMTSNMIYIQKVNVGSGRFFSPQEGDRDAPVVFIGTDVVDNLFPNSDPVGKTLKIGGRDFLVVGVAEKQGSALGQSKDTFAYIPLGMFQRMYGIRRSISIWVKAKDPKSMENSIDQARMVLRARRHLRYKDNDNFGIITSAGINNIFENLTRIIFSVAVFVVGISLVVGGIVIMNIMLVSVIERTKEVGVRKAVGARHADIMKQFLIESVILCCVGGFIGVALGFLTSFTIAHTTPLPSQFPLWAPLLAVGLCSVIGIFFGIYPARKAARLDPIEALRSE